MEGDFVFQQQSHSNQKRDSQIEKMTEDNLQHEKVQYRMPNLVLQMQQLAGNQTTIHFLRKLQNQKSAQTALLEAKEQQNNPVQQKVD